MPTYNKHYRTPVSQMDGYSGADIAALCSIASLSAIREHVEKYEDPMDSMKHKDELVLSKEHFEYAFEKVGINV